MIVKGIIVVATAFATTTLLFAYAAAQVAKSADLRAALLKEIIK